MSKKSTPSPVSVILSEMGIKHVEFKHPEPIKSIEQAAAERNQDIDQIVRSILFRLSTESFAMVLMAGKRQISWRKLRQHFGQSRLTIATPEEVEEITSYKIGAVSPFGIPKEIPILVNQRVFEQPAVSIGSGIRGTTIILTTENLKQALGDVGLGDFES